MVVRGGAAALWGPSKPGTAEFGRYRGHSGLCVAAMLAKSPDRKRPRADDWWPVSNRNAGRSLRFDFVS